MSMTYLPLPVHEDLPSGRGAICHSPTDRVQCADDGGRSQRRDKKSPGRPDGDRRGLEQAVPCGTQPTAVMATHSGVNRGRSHRGGRVDDGVGRKPTDGSGGARGGEPISQGDEKDPKGHSGAEAKEDQGGAKGMEESDRARGMTHF